MERRRNIKAVSMHLDMIISFSLFFIFVIFLLLYIRPYQRASFSETIIDNLHEKFSNVVSVDFIQFSLKINNEVSASSVCIDMWKFPHDINDSGISVLNSYGNFVSGYNYIGTENGNMCINSGKGDYTIQLTKEFSSGSLISGTEITSENYSIGGIETKKYWANSLIIGIKNRYIASSADYESLKKDLGFPLNADFAILCQNCREDYNMTREIPDNSDVITSEYTQMILNQQGEVFEGKFLFKIW